MTLAATLKHYSLNSARFVFPCSTESVGCFKGIKGRYEKQIYKGGIKGVPTGSLNLIAEHEYTT